MTPRATHAAGVHGPCPAARAASAALLALAVFAGPGAGQTPPTGREAIEALPDVPLVFEAPVPDRHEIGGVSVLLLEDHELPLVSVMASFRGGYGRFPRESYAATIGLPAMLRYGGTSTLSPDSVDALLELRAIQTSFGTGGATITSTVEALTDELDGALDLWGDMLARPGFDTTQIAIWRGRELEAVRRRADEPASQAYAEFNRLMYGDHPVGWQLEPSDLAPDRLERDDFGRVHRRIVCADNVVLGVAGDVTWEEIEPRLSALVDALGPCLEPLPPVPAPDIRVGGGVFAIDREVEQTTIVMAHRATVRLSDDPVYFAATIANSILGAGGFSSRIMGRVRTEEGYAYSASSLWTTPRRFDGLVGAVTQTRPETALPATRAILETMEEMRSEPPSNAEVRTAVDRVVNGFVFNFEAPSQVVARMVTYLQSDMPEDWLDTYVAGIQLVTPDAIRDVIRDHVDPSAMTILLLGDLDRIGRDALAGLGPVTVLDVD